MTYIALLHLISFQVQKKIAVVLFLYQMRRNKQSKLNWAFSMIIISKKWKKSAWWKQKIYHNFLHLTHSNDGNNVVNPY